MQDTTVCGSFSCLYSDNCDFFQAFGFRACSGSPDVTRDGCCANFMCECCEDRHCFEIGQDFSESAIH